MQLYLTDYHLNQNQVDNIKKKKTSNTSLID